MISKVQVLRNRLKAICVEQWIIVAEILFLFTICFLHSVSAGHYVDFYPMNGTFQNYNPVRRYLAGQVPYRDFQDYLGFGHQIMGSITTVLFGGDYQRSLMAFSFLTILSFAMLSVVIGLAIFQKKTVVLGITNIMLVFMLTNSFFFINWGGVLEEVKGALVASLEVGNSARFVRGMIIPVVCILLLLCHHLFIQMIKRKSAWVQYGVYIKIIGVGLIAGLAFIWSNDYGISCWVCLLVMTFIVVFSRTRKIKYALLYTIFEMFISTLWIFIFVEIITLGHFRNWFLGTFGTGGYQNWYYNSLGMSFFLFDVDFSFLMLIEGFLCVIYLIKLFVCHADTRSLVRYGVPAFIIMTGFCAGNEYKLLSGGELRQMALSALFLTVLYEFLVFVCSYGKKKKICEIVIIYSSIVSLAWIISDFKQEVLFWKVDEKIGQYISQLGGRITSLGQDLTDTSRFLDGDSFFATYASAQEVVENTFQPSGTDYIIHALGDSQREKYLNSFKKGDFTYTATIKETYELYEYWCQRANWFLYRELYDKWHPVYANAYEKYWARNTQEETHTLSGKYNIEVENVDESTKKLILRTDKS